ncbi:MAG: DUF362 domain-containing protein [Candidatus Kapaibacterium sp.]
MKRRDFLMKSLTAALAAGAAGTIGSLDRLAVAAPNSAKPYDMIAIKNGGAARMFEEAIKAWGGMSKVVRKGQTVVVKPNIGWDASPERAANTNPELVGRVISACYEAGAKKVYVFDHTCDEWSECYSSSGIERAAKQAGATVVSGASESYYQDVSIPKGKKLKSAKVHELILENDVFINIPVLKNHGSAKLTIAMKNLMGIVWDRRYWHKNDLHQCIADFATWRAPDLNIVDAYRVMLRNGPRGVSTDDVSVMKTQLIARDMVAIDTAAAKIFGAEPSAAEYIAIAGDMGVGEMNLDNLNIKRIKL